MVNLDLIKFYLILPSKTNNCFNSFQILGIICMICASPAYTPATHWFLFVIVTSFIATLLWCFIYLLSIREALKLPINWILTVKKTIRKTALDDYNFYFIHIFFILNFFIHFVLNFTWREKYMNCIIIIFISKFFCAFNN